MARSFGNPIPLSKKRKIVSLGKYPDVSILAARRKKDEVRMKVLEGFDPMARLERKNATSHRDLQLSKNSTFQEVANLWYLIWKKGKPIGMQKIP